MTYTLRDLEAAMEATYGSYWADIKWSIEKNGDTININGEDYKVEYVTFKVDNKTYQKTGYYQSHYGSEWDGPVFEVRPKQVTVTEWERV